MGSPDLLHVLRAAAAAQEPEEDQDQPAREPRDADAGADAGAHQLAARHAVDGDDDEEEEYVVAQANTPVNPDGSFAQERVLVRRSPQAASLEDLRTMCLEADIKMIACQMTIDLFEFKQSEFIDGIELGGAATFLEFAGEADVTLFI